MKTNTTQNKVQATNTENNVATTIYKVYDIQNNLCKVMHNNVEYKGKLLNTSPTTHLYFNKLDILVPAYITIDNNVQIYTKTTQYEGIDNQAKFKQILNLLQGKTFEFDKSKQAKTTTRNNTTKTKANVLEYINANDKLKNEYTTLKQQLDNAKTQFDNAKTKFDNFMQTQQQNATQKQAQNTVTQLLQSGLITIEQLQAISQKQSEAK